MANVVCWDTDGHTFKVYSDDVLVFEAPFSNLTDPATVVLGKDPITGLPKWSAALDPTTIVNIVTPDTGPLPLPTGTDVQTTPTVPTTVVPDPVVDNCPMIRCGAAHQLAAKLAEQYDLIRSMLQWMTSAPFLIVAGPLVGGDTITVGLLKLLVSWLIKTGVDSWVTAVITFVLNKIAKGAITAALTFEALDDAGIEQIALLAYVNLTCADNTFQLIPDMVSNWGAAILLDSTDFTEWQRHLLTYCIQFTPFQTYGQTAASGAQHPSDACIGWTWG